MTALAKHRARHFDRGFRSALPAVALLAACSSSLNDPSTAGSAGRGGNGGFTNDCGALSGAGNCARGGSSGPTGAGGTGGSAPLPACTATAATFGVCFVNDAEDPNRLPFDASTSGAATVEAIGSGYAPASCRERHAVGIRNESDWWIQARAADNRLWTIGVSGLGAGAPAIHVGDTVSLVIDWHNSTAVPGAVGANGNLQLSDAAGTPLLWAGSSAWGATQTPNPSTWISFAPGGAACAETCAVNPGNRTDVIATVNGSSTTLPPDGAATLSGYSLAATYFASLCGDYAPPFEAAAVKVAATN